MIEVNCNWCNCRFKAKEADRKRGWAKFCSKSCKAKEQTKRIGVSGIFSDNWQDEAMNCVEAGWDGHKVWTS